MSVSLLGLVLLIYLGVAIAEWRAGRLGMCLTFLGYAVANLGLMWELR